MHNIDDGAMKKSVTFSSVRAVCRLRPGEAAARAILASALPHSNRPLVQLPQMWCSAREHSGPVVQLISGVPADSLHLHCAKGRDGLGAGRLRSVAAGA